MQFSPSNKASFHKLTNPVLMRNTVMQYSSDKKLPFFILENMYLRNKKKTRKRKSIKSMQLPQANFLKNLQIMFYLYKNFLGRYISNAEMFSAE